MFHQLFGLRWPASDFLLSTQFQNLR